MPDQNPLPVPLRSVSFANPQAAWILLQRLDSRQQGSLAGIMPALAAALEAAADPDRSLVFLERFAENYGPALFPALAANPRLIEILITLFSASQFLTEILLRNPDSLHRLLDRQEYTRRKTIEQFQSEAEAGIRQAESEAEKLDSIRRYQRGELLRIGACDFLELYDLRAVVSQLSRLATGLIRAGLNLAARQTGVTLDGFTVLALGKLGGRELNYSSDVDLLFIARGDTGRYQPLAEKFIQVMGQNTPEGFLYRVDLRLRPWGKDGPLVNTLDSYLHYLREHARLWEKQALLKVRPIAGELGLGEALRELVYPLLYSNPPEQVRAGVFAMKQRTEQFLCEKGRRWGEVKLGEGSIRDIEFVLQVLQLIHVNNHPELRTRATLKGLAALKAAGLLTSAETTTLSDGYVFLRTVEHHLQMLDYRQTYTLPSDPTAIALLARRLGFQEPLAGEAFMERYQQHCRAIRAVFLHHVGSMPMNDDPVFSTGPDEAENPQVRQHLARLDASYAETFSPAEIQHHAALAARLDPERLAVVESRALDDGRWKVTIVAYDYPGELSIICGLMFLHGLNILDGQVFTYEPLEAPGEPARPRGRHPGRTASTQRKIVDVFTVAPVSPDPLPDEAWARYQDDLTALLGRMRTGQRREARGELARRVGAAFEDLPEGSPTLYPIEIEIDNQASERYTLLRIDGTDTFGFLYELTNALAIYRIYIARVIIDSIGNRVQDILFVTDADGHKIGDLERQRELRTAIVLIKHFTHLLPRSPNPEAALLHFREFLGKLFQRPNWPDELASIERPEVLDNLARLLGVSDFLWDDFLRMQYANLFPVVQDLDALQTVKVRQQLQAELEAALLPVHDGAQAPRPEAPWRGVVNDFKDREMFRIDMRHILGHTREFDEFSEELTDLAEVLVNATYHLAAEDLRSVHGTPLLVDGAVSQMAVFALGKCGGRELGFASDIELMFIYTGDGKTAGPQVIASAEFHERVVHDFLNAVLAKRKGIFEIDLQLRPYGKAGSLAVSLEAFQRYFAPGGPAWAYERQALVKLRPIAGDQDLGEQISALRDGFVYTGEPFDVSAMRAMRERQLRHLVSGGTFNAKYSPGGLVDIEYLVQGLQISHGAGDPSLRSTNLRAAMAGLHAAGHLSSEEYTRLRKAHTFMRWLIDSLRVVRGDAQDVSLPPYESEEFSFLARRLLYGNDAARLRDELERYSSDIQEMNLRLLA
ncbi:MAG: hypothetical protein JXB85_14000 [Anaerolineales bacterium]|nr:hypothetical protein [Anaerolineales bacterium]